MTAYRMLESDYVIRTKDGACIPPDPQNRDRVEFESWLAAGNVADPNTPPPAPRARTAEERIEAALGVTVSELKTVLGIGAR